MFDNQRQIFNLILKQKKKNIIVNKIVLGVFDYIPELRRMN